MNRHFDGNEQDVIRKIAEWIARNADAEGWLQGPLWMILGVRVAHITPGHELWELLDAGAKGVPFRNYLMWKGHIKFDDTITVTHFGPLGINQEKTLKQDFQKLKQRFWADMMNTLGIGSAKEMDQKSPPERSSAMDQMRNMLDRQYLAIKAKKVNEIEIVKALLNDLIATLFGAVEEGVKVTEMFARAVGPTATKLVLKEISVIVLKQIAKEIAAISAKQGGKQGGKSFVKKVPVVGLCVGLGLGTWRMLCGDPGRAALEVASGAASCAPGLGTAVSVGLDVAIAGVDIAEAISIYTQKRNRFLQYAHQLEQLLSEQARLEKSYHRIQRAYDDFDFEDDADDLINAINYIDL